MNNFLKEMMESTELKLHLGCGRQYLDGWVNIDNAPNVRKDLNYDLESAANTPLPYEDNSVSYIYCAHLLEHIRNILPLMQELYRVAKPGAIMFALVPHGANDAAFADPTHVRHFVGNSFSYFGQSVYGGADYSYTADWEPIKLAITVQEGGLPESPEEAEFLLHSTRNFAQDYIGILRANKPARTEFTGIDSPRVELFVQK